MTGHDRFGVPLRASDGAVLVHDAHVPHTAGPGARVPCVVTRTPYGRSRHLAEGRGWRERGWAFVVQDVRGRHDSDGTWAPYRGERADGAALVDWVTAQPWSDGRVIAHGGSYSGYTAWAMAVERPSAVRAVVSLGPSMSLARTKFGGGGILRLAEHASWWLERGDSRTSRDGLAALVFRERPGLLRHLPVVDLPREMGAHLPSWAGIVDDGAGARTGEEITRAELAALTAATLHVGGWHDLLLPETLEHHGVAGSDVPGTPSHLLVGPWEHDLVGSGSGRVGDLDHGDDAVIPWGRMLVDWIRDALDGTLAARRARVHVRGSGWEDHDAWPPPHTPTRVAWTTGGALAFVHDPRDPRPSRHPGVDRRALASRPDAVRAVTRPLDAPLRLTGDVAVELTSGSDAPGTDWIARLLARDRDGAEQELAVGEATVAGPHEGVRIGIPLGPVAALLPAGTVLVLELAGADAPRLARNLGGPPGERCTSTTQSPVRQRVILGAASPLTLVLPIAAGTAPTPDGGRAGGEPADAVGPADPTSGSAS
ncbi:CocE/NonD family hydrolase [Clavibacter sepedonicus]|uniref:Hydrolase n=1 Tax=Clavibacter sepedonicus TaxID=31964 RepID=B0RBD8_CLASE|nr:MULTISPECIES: CocE/NonD family hydrolase [Clavibacter]MBD5380926.1 CocE/NonD family hydrolase [Clavibacter sp.]UUK66920.1 CocE/NonD family hydrolase [Clavibacter sepedonicus]CAQ01679.1 putative hydrolase [Clavibacter sepedonicus]